MTEIGNNQLFANWEKTAIVLHTLSTKNNKRTIESKRVREHKNTTRKRANATHRMKRDGEQIRESNKLFALKNVLLAEF